MLQHGRCKRVGSQVLSGYTNGVGFSFAMLKECAGGEGEGEGP